MISYPLAVGSTLTRAIEQGQGDLVLFIHGVGARADRWSRNIEALGRAGRRCVALDLPGHGFAQKGEGFDYSVEGYADFIAEFIRSQDVARVTLVGTSLGGHVAAAVTCREPDRIAKLVLVGATGLFPVGAEAVQRIAERILDRSREGVRAKLANVVYELGLVTPELVEEEFQINNSPGSTESFAALAHYFRSRLDKDVIGPRLAAQLGSVPMMLIWGEEDRSVPLSVGEKAAELFSPTVPLKVIPRSAHTPYFERPAEFNRLLEAFLGDEALAGRLRLNGGAECG